MDEVNLSIDLGSSLTKAVWSWGGCQGTCNFLTMEPEVLPCGSDHLDAYRTQRVNLYATTREDLWVKLNKGDENAYAVGFLAQSLLAHVNLKALKYESALHKILAIIGAIAEQQQATSLTVNLAVLLLGVGVERSQKVGRTSGQSVEIFLV